jgi:hypothetical protein
MEMQLTWLLDEKHEEAGASDLRDAIAAVGDRHLTLSRQEARYESEMTCPLHCLPDKAKRFPDGEAMCPRRFADKHGGTLLGGIQ